ncbi:hypothetical protein EYF80_056400 [Liparis tanakae]|uniref:Uncharacterized protein n=1 Tax=Liparis tanakae TaxID=230148 RepID=A0A4Z2EWZ3_9TELE|nr:hypothetical protein EYF80_056400 [Liparis tanakae]
MQDHNQKLLPPMASCILLPALIEDMAHTALECRQLKPRQPLTLSSRCEEAFVFPWLVQTVLTLPAARAARICLLFPCEDERTSMAPSRLVCMQETRRVRFPADSILQGFLFLVRLLNDV